MPVLASKLLVVKIRRLHVPYPYNIIFGRDMARVVSSIS